MTNLSQLHTDGLFGRHSSLLGHQTHLRGNGTVGRQLDHGLGNHGESYTTLRL